jgi:hypothetical protein
MSEFDQNSMSSSSSSSSSVKVLGKKRGRKAKCDSSDDDDTELFGVVHHIEWLQSPFKSKVYYAKHGRRIYCFDGTRKPKHPVTGKRYNEPPVYINELVAHMGRCNGIGKWTHDFEQESERMKRACSKKYAYMAKGRIERISHIFCEKCATDPRYIFSMGDHRLFEVPKRHLTRWLLDNDFGAPGAFEKSKSEASMLSRIFKAWSILPLSCLNGKLYFSFGPSGKTQLQLEDSALQFFFKLYNEARDEDKNEWERYVNGVSEDTYVKFQAWIYKIWGDQITDPALLAYILPAKKRLLPLFLKPKGNENSMTRAQKSWHWEPKVFQYVLAFL